MLKIMRDETEDMKNRGWAAAKAAPFIHPRPAPIARPIVIDLPDTSTVEGIKAALGVITAAVASGQIAPAEANLPASRAGVMEDYRQAAIRRPTGPIDDQAAPTPQRRSGRGSTAHAAGFPTSMRTLRRR